ncbi:MAG: hypothetical protein LLG05_18590 [Porphyromonadaceae bacterium]|nr:hypothetical protein [Porphyromonadaceae bacterium]
MKESSDGGKQIKAASVDLDEFSPDHSSSMYIYGLYDEEQPGDENNKKSEIRIVNSTQKF